MLFDVCNEFECDFGMFVDVKRIGVESFCDFFLVIE